MLDDRSHDAYPRSHACVRCNETHWNKKSSRYVQICACPQHSAHTQIDLIENNDNIRTDTDTTLLCTLWIALNR